MNLKIRKVNELDKISVLALGRKTVDIYERTHLGDEIADGYINSGSCDNDLCSIYNNASVAVLDDEIIGFIFIKDNEIQGLSVDTSYWGKGVAQKLIAYAFNIISENYDEIVLECFVTSPRANNFYKKMGFVNCGIVDGDGGNRVKYKRLIRSEKLIPKQILLNWIDMFNNKDAKALAELYYEDAVNHQVIVDPLMGKQAIYCKFVEEFNKFEMVCIPENIFEDGEWAIMEWRDTKGFRGCGFFNIINGKIKFQRGYMDKLSFLNINNLSNIE